MPVTNFGALTTDGRRISNTALLEKLPITAELIATIQRDDDLQTVLSAITTAIMKLESKGVEFPDDDLEDAHWNSPRYRATIALTRPWKG